MIKLQNSSSNPSLIRVNILKKHLNSKNPKINQFEVENMCHLALLEFLKEIHKNKHSGK